MSDMTPEEGGGGITSQRFLGLPVLAWVGIVVILVLLYMKGRKNAAQGQQGAASSQSSGGPNTQTLTTGNTTVDTGAVQVSVNAGGSSTAGGTGGSVGGTASNAGNNPQPQPPVDNDSGDKDKNGEHAKSPQPQALNAKTYGGPNLMGLTSAQAKTRLQGTQWFINNDSTDGSVITSFTPYSNHSINIGSPR